jgi:hypothetical protein
LSGGKEASKCHIEKRRQYTKEKVMIKGISEIRRLPRLGKIRLGEKKTTESGKEYPVETSHFVVPGEVARIYGDKPNSLDILLPVENLGVVFPQAMKLYSTRGLICAGNGETATFYNPASRNMEAKTCPCDKVDEDCKRLGSLMVILPRVCLGGIYQIDTSSFNSIVNINSNLADDGYIKALCGRISFIPLTLKRVAQEMQYEDKKGELKKSTHYPMTITFEGTLADVTQYRQDFEIPFKRLYGDEYMLEAPAALSRKVLPENVEDHEEELANRTTDLAPTTRSYTLQSDKGSEDTADASANQKKDPEPRKKPATPSQLAAIGNMAKKLGVETLQAIRTYADIVVNTVESLTFVQAESVIRAFNGKVAEKNKPNQPLQNGKLFKPPKNCTEDPLNCPKVFYTGSGKDAKYHCGDIVGPECPYGSQKHKAA